MTLFFFFFGMLRLPYRILPVGWLENRNLFYHSSGSLKSKIKVPSELVSGECSLLSLQKALFSVHLQMVFPLSTWEEKEISDIPSSSCKKASTSRLGPHPLPHLNLFTYPKTCFQGELHWVVGLQHVNFGGRKGGRKGTEFSPEHLSREILTHLLRFTLNT